MSPPYILHFIPQLQLLYHQNKYSYFSFSESIVPEWGAQYQNNYLRYYHKGMLWHYEAVRRQYAFYIHC